jgi:hypothetical protein
MAKTKNPHSVVQLSLPLRGKTYDAHSSKPKVVGLSEKRAEKTNKDENRLYKSILSRIKHLED